MGDVFVGANLVEMVQSLFLSLAGGATASEPVSLGPLGIAAELAPGGPCFFRVTCLGAISAEVT